MSDIISCGSQFSKICSGMTMEHNVTKQTFSTRGVSQDNAINVTGHSMFVQSALYLFGTLTFLVFLVCFLIWLF